MLEKMEYWKNGIKKQKNQFHYSNNHFQPIIPAFQPSNIPELLEYHQFLTKSIIVFLSNRDLGEWVFLKRDGQQWFLLPFPR